MRPGPPADPPPPASLSAPGAPARHPAPGGGIGKEGARGGAGRAGPAQTFKTARRPRLAPQPVACCRRQRPRALSLPLALSAEVPATMLVLLAFIIAFHVTSAALLFAATINNAWWVGDQFSTDLWKLCINGSNCSDVLSESFEGYTALQAVQASMILATILCCMAFLIFLLQLFRLKQGERFILTSIIQFMSCLCVMIAASIYTDQREEFHQNDIYYGLGDGSYGNSFILAWVAFAFTFISGLMYLILRKRK